MTRLFKNIWFPSLWICLLWFCAMHPAYAQLAEETRVVEGEGQKLRIAPDLAAAGTGEDLFDSIRYVPLETTKESEFRTISQLVATHDRYIILDQRLNTVLFFAKDGSFIQKISPKSKGLPRPYQSLWRFSVNEQAGFIVCYFSDATPNYYFDMEGNFLRKEPKKYVAREGLFKGMEVLYYGFRNENVEAEDGLFPNLEVYDPKNGERISSYFYYDTARMDYATELFISGPYFYASGADRFFFSQPYDYSLYELLPDGKLTEKYRVVLPMEIALPPDFLSDSTYDGKRKEYIQSTYSTPENIDQRRKPVVYVFKNVYQIKNWLTLGFSGSNALLYNTGTGDLYDFEKTDLSKKGFSSSVGKRDVLAVDGDALVTALDFAKIVGFYEENSHDDRLGMRDLKSFLKKKFHNPILQLSYLKD